MSILDELREVTIDILNVDEKDITPAASFKDDLGADSLDLVELVMAIEKRFGIEIPDEDAEKLSTVQDALNYLKGKGIVG